MHKHAYTFKHEITRHAFICGAIIYKILINGTVHLCSEETFILENWMHIL